MPYFSYRGTTKAYFAMNKKDVRGTVPLSVVCCHSRARACHCSDEAEGKSLGFVHSKKCWSVRLVDEEPKAHQV